jgi:hypothetical protein
LGRRLATLLLWLLAAALLPASANAASLSYIGADGNAHLASPDGARTVQLTRDATADATYKMAGQTNAGTVVVARREGGDTWYHWLNRDGSNKSGPWLAPKGNLGTGPLTSHVAPEGGAVVFYASNCTFACQQQYFRVVFMPEGPLASECNINCHDGYVLPRWIPGTPFAGMIDSGLNSVYVQSESGLQEWFGYQGNFDIGHFDVSRDRGFILTEDTPTTASEPGTLTLLKANGIPPNHQTPEVLCEIQNFSADGNGNPVWSPDGTQIAWTAADGIHVSGAPADQGNTCTLPGDRLVVPGGKQVEWGPQDVPAPGGGGPGGGPGGGGGGLVLTFSIPGQRIIRALVRGLRIRTGCRNPCRLRGDFLVDSGLLARAVSVARGSKTLRRAGRTTLVLKFTRRAKRKLRRFRRIRGTVRLRATPLGGGRATVRRKRVTLRR